MLRVRGRLSVVALWIAAAFLLGGCAAGPAAKLPTGGGAGDGRAGRPAEAEDVRVPFAYRSLGVRNSCFVESVHFYDLYRGLERNGAEGWVRVLQWGHRDGDFKIKLGHAVAVCKAAGRLWEYDVNFGFVPLNAPPSGAAYLSNVTPEIFARYPQFKQVLAKYREDFEQPRPEKVPEFLFYHTNADVRDATKVASELGRFRPTRVVEFEYPEGGVMRGSAVALFIFGRRLCAYHPAGGTYVMEAFAKTPDDLKVAEAMVRRMQPGAVNVRWHEGGYWFFPPKS